MMKKKALAFGVCAVWSMSFSYAQTTPGVKDSAVAETKKELSRDNQWIFGVKGFVQVDYMFDTQEIGSKDGFLASTIVTPQHNSNSSYFSVRQSQLGMEVKRRDDKFSAYIEIDMFGPNGTTAPRLRKAYITYDKWLLGQDWSTFSDLGIWPNIFDFSGPNAPMSVRQLQLRYTTNLAKKSQLSLSLENPNAASIRLPSDSLQWKKKALIPNFVAAYRYGGDRSYIRLAGILSPISYEMRDNVTHPYTTKTIWGGGVNLTGAVYLTQLSSLKLQASYGSGISTNNVALNGEGYDAIPNLYRGNQLRALPFFSTSGAYEHWWNSRWSSVIFYGYARVGGGSIPDGMIKKLQNAGINIVYQPFSKFRIGIEGHYGMLQKYGIQKYANAFRCQLSTALSF